MKNLGFTPGALLLVLIPCLRASAAPTCSTEKVNNECSVIIDRSYPVILPTIQMRRGEVVHVQIKHALPFESLSLDLQAGQALAGTDQTAGFITGAVPQLKGAMIQTQKFAAYVKDFGIKTIDGGGEPQSITAYRSAYEKFNNDLKIFSDDTTAVYAQLNEIIGPIPPTVLPNGARPTMSPVQGSVPLPWNDYANWRIYLTCEIAAEGCPAKPVPPEILHPAIQGLLARATTLMNQIAVPCPAPKTSYPVFSCMKATITSDIAAMGQTEQAKFSDYLQTLDNDTAVFAADSQAITTLVKDLSTYYANIASSKVIATSDPLGDIPDPLNVERNQNTHLPKYLGRQVTYSVNALNEIATSTASVLGSSSKKSVATITVVYADPIFETSAGVFFSTLANRTFANQTLITQNSTAPPTQGNIVIGQTISRPTAVPFVGANWRFGPNFNWMDGRRGAGYFTAAVGLNPYNTLVEFAGGPSISWRALLFSGLFHFGHDVRLTQGEYVGEVWCNATAATGTIPKCSGNPPSPSTERYWRVAFALGISVRVPSVFSGSSSSSASGK